MVRPGAVLALLLPAAGAFCGTLGMSIWVGLECPSTAPLTTNEVFAADGAFVCGGINIASAMGTVIQYWKIKYTYVDQVYHIHLCDDIDCATCDGFGDDGYFAIASADMDSGDNCNGVTLLGIGAYMQFQEYCTMCATQPPGNATPNAVSAYGYNGALWQAGVCDASISSIDTASGCGTCAETWGNRVNTSQPCVFPFFYGIDFFDDTASAPPMNGMDPTNQWHHGCTEANSPGRAWCATRTSCFGTGPYGDGWAYCTPGCSVEEGDSSATAAPDGGTTAAPTTDDPPTTAAPTTAATTPAAPTVSAATNTSDGDDGAADTESAGAVLGLMVAALLH